MGHINALFENTVKIETNKQQILWGDIGAWAAGHLSGGIID